MDTRTMYWNGNEIVFNDDSSVGVAGIADGQPDELAEEIVRRWNLVVKTIDAIRALGLED